MVEEAIGSASVVTDQEIHVHQGEEEAEEDLTPADLTVQTEAEDVVPEEEGEATHQEEDTLTEATLTSQEIPEEIEETERIPETLEIQEIAEM